jgi:hypothetical protein
MPQTKKRRRKLALHEISKCNPSVKHVENGKCLPQKVYTRVAEKLSTTVSDDIFQKVGCKNGEEHCLLDKSGMDNNESNALRKQYLRPKRPNAWEDKPNTWLDNYNIKHVMDQYVTAYPWFKFLGVFPIDFSVKNPYNKNGKEQCLYKETCNIKLIEEYNKGIRGIGMIFNLDPHYKGGSHWVGLYINLNNIKVPMIGYYDSYGYATPPMIARLMRSFKLQIKECQLGYNGRRFQRGGSECGMFSLYFIICMIHGIRFKDFCKDMVDDAYMLELRKILFSR